MKNLTEIRRNNLLSMIDEYRITVFKGVRHGAMTSFARHMAMNPVQLSQLKNGTAPIGNPLARQIESKAGKPSLWMDDEFHLVDMTDLEQVNFLNIAMRLYRISPSAAKDTIMLAMLDQIEHLSSEK